MRMDPVGIGGSACAKQSELRVSANRASVIHQARGERSEIVIAGLQKGPPARGRWVVLQAHKSSKVCKRRAERGKRTTGRIAETVCCRHVLKRGMRRVSRHAQRNTSTRWVVNPRSRTVSWPMNWRVLPAGRRRWLRAGICRATWVLHRFVLHELDARAVRV